MPAFDKVHPLVLAQTTGVDSATIDSFLVTFVDTIGPAVRTLGLSKQDLAQMLNARRAAVYDTLAEALRNRYSAERISDFMLIKAIFLRMPVGLVDSLSKNADVVRIEPMLGGPPPQATYGICGNDTHDLAFASAHVGSNDYVEAGYGGGAIALFDTGVYTEHNLLKGSGRMAALYDCDESGCVLTEVQHDLKDSGHGTASAAILMGYQPESPEDVGLTKAELVSYNVYAINDTGGLQVSLPAAAHAMDNAATGRATLFVAEIATTTEGPGALSKSTGEAFDYGVIVIAANGNVGSALHSPADATRVLGVGAYCWASNAYVSEYFDGETGDGRWKPDLTGPTSTYTAANGEPNAPNDMSNYDGTSGAAPIASGAALLLSNRMQFGFAGTLLPGNVYAALLVAAASEIATDPELANPPQVEAAEGAGRVRLPNDGALYWGTLDVAEKDAWEIPIHIETDAAATIEALIWWPRAGPESSAMPTTEWRSDIDLRLLDPSGNEKMKSDSAGRVQERVFDNVPAGSSGKWWAVDIYGYSVPGGAKQDVYWAVWVRNAE